MLDRLSIFRKGLLLIAVPLCFQLAFIALVAVIRQRNTSAERWAIHSNAVIAQAEACGYRILSAHGAVQGSIITHDAIFGAEARRLSGISRQELQRLVDLVGDNLSQTALARRVQAHAAILLDFIEEGAALIDGPGMPADVAIARRRAAQRLLEDFRAELNQFVAAEQGLNSARRNHLMVAWRRLDFLLIGGFVLSILSSLLIAYLFSRSISGRIGTLAKNSRLLSGGHALMPPLEGGDEIARLDAVFREMAMTLAIAMRRERHDADVASRRAEETVAINAQLRDKAQENEMFVYSVSHDLRSPLVNLQGFSKELGLIGKDLVQAVDRDEVPENIRRQARSLIEVEMRESVGFIQSAVTRLSSIIDALLRLSRAGRVEYHPRLVDVEPVVARVLAALRGTIVERGAQVTVKTLPPSYADPTVIEQVFANLIGNALNYLDPARPGRVEVAATTRDEAGTDPMVVYAISDNGLGIAESYHGKIFTVFQRLHGDIAKGEGVGLALVRRMIERNGGQVWFESAAGRGSTFFFAVPAHSPPAEPGSSPKDQPKSAPELEAAPAVAGCS